MRRPRLLRIGALPVLDNAARWQLVLLLAAMTYVVSMVGIGLVALGDTGHGWRQALGGTLTLQLPPDTSPARVEVALALLRQTPGISAAQPLAAAETARLLQPWLGKSAPVDIMPLPQLVDIRIDTAAPPDLAGLEQRLRNVVPGAELEDHRLWLARLLAFAARLRLVGIAVIAAAFAVAALSAASAAAAWIARNGPRLSLLHALGAEDFEVAGAFVLPAAGRGLVAGAIGASAAAGTWQAVVGAVGRLGAAATVPTAADHRTILLLAGAALASGLISAAAAGIAAWRGVARLP